jgi:aspartate kinase
MKVCKFGGSSVASADQIRKVKAILDKDSERTLLVVSAPGKRFSTDEKITDLLYLAASLVEENDAGHDVDQVFDRIAVRYRDIAEELGIGESAIDDALEEVLGNIKGGRGSAYSASRGEYLSARLIAKYLGWEFLDTEGVIIIGDDNKVEDITYTQLKEKLKKGKKYVIPGFYGTSLSGEITTFSRGGSDITGAIVARAAGADMYENWTDVSGVYSSDPRKVKSAHVIKALSYREVREFSEVGASVLHEEAIAPCIGKGIPINIRNTNSPDDEGTIIGKTSSHTGVVGVSGKGGLTEIYCRKLLLFKESDIAHRILALLRIYGIKPSHTMYGCDSISWYFDTKQIDKVDTESMCSRIKEEFHLDEFLLEKGYAVVGLVGDHMEETMEYVDALAALRSHSIRPYSVSLGGSYTTFLIGVKEEDKDEAVSLISDTLFGEKN